MTRERPTVVACNKATIALIPNADSTFAVNMRWKNGMTMRIGYVKPSEDHFVAIFKHDVSEEMQEFVRSALVQRYGRTE